MINLAVFGYGTVGSGVVEVLEINQASIEKKVGQSLQVKYILDLRKFPGDANEAKIVDDVEKILNDKDVHIICETMGGVHPAYEFTKRALEDGKSVCTSNKELVANHGSELIQIAKDNGCKYLFEASVGGGIPIIRPINDALVAEKIEAITGILNGTTNFILTKMEQEGADFETVLKEAQDKGYAEKNPEADVEGHDACRKIAILSSLMLGKNVNYEHIYTEGITKITAKDFLYAKKMHKSIKILGMSKQIGEHTLAMVAPFMIKQEHPLYMVRDVFNGILVRGNMLGDTMYYGKGAGKLPTASAVMADVIECARNQEVQNHCFWEKEEANLLSIDDVKRQFFFRISLEGEEKVKEIFGQDIEIVHVAELKDEVGVVTPMIKECEYKEHEKKIENWKIGNAIRLED